MNQYLLKLQIGPVQEFIAQARTTRDLWSGSYLLSWLMGHAVKALEAKYGAGAIVFPAVGGQPLLEWLDHPEAKPTHQAAALTPSLPNVCIALVPASENDTAGMALAVKEVISTEFRNIAEACWKELLEASKPLVTPGQKERFDSQIRHFLSVSWQVTPWAADYESTYQRNGWQLDAVRQTRDFRGWCAGGWSTGHGSNKDSLTGREEAICGGNKWWTENISALSGFWPTVFRERHAGDFYGAITLVKRLWHRIYLSRKPWDIDVARALPIPSTWHVANHDPEKDEEGDMESASDAQTHFAVVAMDGDRVGKRLGAFREPSEHREFSARLGSFALGHAAAIVRAHDGRLVYAGGDDVLALLPADTALCCAEDLRNKFREVLGFKDIDASAGVAIARFKEPLQDVVRAAQSAERRAKNEMGRASVAVTLSKGSGEIIEWGCRWESGGLRLHEVFANELQKQALSGGAPYRFLELLTPYLSECSPLLEERRSVRDAGGFEAIVDEVIRREFDIVLDHQGRSQSQEVKARLRGPLQDYLAYLSSHVVGSQPAIKAKLKAIVGLCETVAFAKRTAPTSAPSATRQTA